MNARLAEKLKMYECKALVEKLKKMGKKALRLAQGASAIDTKACAISLIQDTVTTTCVAMLCLNGFQQMSVTGVCSIWGFASTG